MPETPEKSTAESMPAKRETTRVDHPSSTHAENIDHAETQCQAESLKHSETVDQLAQLGYVTTYTRNRSMWTLLFQSLSIAAIPYGIGSPLISAIYGGGQLSLFVGWIVVTTLTECIALSIAELASLFPTSAGPYYWSYQIATRGKIVLSFITGWTWLLGNWTITLAVNFGFASLLAATITMWQPEWVATSWQLVLILYAILIVTFLFCWRLNRWLPQVDTFCAGWTAMTIIVIMIALAVQAKEGRHSAGFALGNYDKSFSGWGGFTLFIGFLPSAYVVCATGMISSMAEECDQPAVKVPRAISLAIPVEAVAGLCFILPICFTMPPLDDLIDAPYGQVLPIIFRKVMGSNAGAMGLMMLVLVLTMCCSISITTAASRCTWALARDDAIPLAKVWTRFDEKRGVPVLALALVTVSQMLLAIINVGSTSAFTAFVSVGVIGLEISYLIPVSVSLWNRRREVNHARFNCGRTLGPIINGVAIVWIAFQTVLFSAPTALPVTAASMNYASVVFVGFAAFSAFWYFVYAHKGTFVLTEESKQKTQITTSRD